MALRGEPSRVREAMRALELISDTFLPVNEIVQASVPAIFERGEPFRASYAAAIRERWQLARSLLSTCPRLRFVEPDGGFYVSLRLEGPSEEIASAVLLEQQCLLVHPGYFYDMPPEHLVLSFVQEPEIMRAVYPRLVNVLERL
jgi:DNA-binding transcriptional MocR family regulator